MLLVIIAIDGVVGVDLLTAVCVVVDITVVDCVIFIECIVSGEQWRSASVCAVNIVVIIF